MSQADRVVYDCNIFVQALISPRGPAAVCVDLAIKQKVALFLSNAVIEEIRDVAQREPLFSRFRLTEKKVENFLAPILTNATMLDDYPHVFDYPRDPDDELYIDLAAACQAHLIASRDRDLLALNDISTVDGQRFRAQFPDLLILNPEQLLARIGDA